MHRFYESYPKNGATARNLGIRNELSSVPIYLAGTDEDVEVRIPWIS